MNLENTTPSLPTQEVIDVRGCRLCGTPLRNVVVDLGLSPLCENVITKADLNRGEFFYPLRAYVCDTCWLIQLHDLVAAEEIYSHYAYFSSNSDSWLQHARNYCQMIVDRLGLGGESCVVEIASNDGYLLREFRDRQVPAYGVEPAANVAQVAIDQGLDCVVQFFGTNTARELVATRGQADLIALNNVIGHVPDLNDFVSGLKILLASQGTITIEIPHAMHLILDNQFDTIYQEHYSYFLLHAMQELLARHELLLFDAEEIPTHGGSIRYFATHANNPKEISPSVHAIAKQEKECGLTELSTYQSYSQRVMQTKWALLEFLIDARRSGKSVAAYGAPGKAATLLNYCGIREDLIQYTVDRNQMKQGTYFVGTRIPIYAPEMLAVSKPDYIVILPWNLKEELLMQLAYARDWGAKFVIPIPELTVC